MEYSRASFFDFTGGRIPDSPLNFLAPWKRGDHDIKLSAGQLARERIGQLVRENYRANQEMSPRLAALVKKLENGSPELSIEMIREHANKLRGSVTERRLRSRP
jgi:hypothetical protein